MSETAAQKKERLAKEKAAKSGWNVVLPSLAGGTGTSISSVDLAGSEFNVMGLGLPLPAGVDQTKVNGSQLYNALVKAAVDDPGTWLPIKYALAQSNFYSGTPSFTPGFQNEDKTAITSFLTTLTHKNSDLAPGQVKTPVATFLAQTQNLAKLYGGEAARTQVQKVTVPNELDLQKIADTAFRNALGKPATLAQQKAFARSFQQDVMAVARASAAQVSRPTPTPSTAAVMGAMTPAATPEAAMKSIQQNAAAGQKQPTTVLRQIQEAPNAALAAEEMAIAAAPADAASQRVDNALNAMFTSLQRNANG